MTQRADQAELARLLSDLRRVLGCADDGARFNSLVNGARDVEDSEEPPAPAPAEGCEKLTEEDIEQQKVIFDNYDVDNTGQLAQSETVRMIRAMQLFDTAEEITSVIKRMDEDNSGTIDFDEYIEYIDEKCRDDEEFYKQYQLRSENTKLGYDGTTWRKHANVQWISANGTIILTTLAILGALIYFSFILVPMTMAYFLTFLLGPLQDLLIQRPLVCCNLVICDKPGIRPALRQHVNCCGKEKSWYKDESKLEANYQIPQERWAGMVKDTGEWDGARMVMRWEDEGTGCCYAVPPPKWSEEPSQGGGPIKHMLWNFFVVLKIPETLSVLVTFVLTGAILALTFIVISAELVDVLEDPSFQAAKTNALIDFNAFLATEHKIAVTELLEANITLEDEVVVYDQSDLETVGGPYILIINDTVTTLLLCLYMLSTRVPETEEHTYKEVQGMTLFEKIQSKIKFYVVLKTALSALTGGLVGMILLGCRVRLAILFGLITFLLNFIPNVGSMVAMVLPIPLILLDEVEADYTGRKALAILLPAVVQMYVGNVLEPTVFGKSLNVTAISVLVSLVLWGSIWGLQGAVLSVPLLAATKTALEDADHPMAKMVLRIVRESASVDDTLEASKSRRQKRMEAMVLTERLKVSAAARFEGLLDHDVEHGAALKGVKIVHHNNLVQEEEEEGTE